MALLIVIVGMSLVVVGFTRRGGKGEGQQQGQGSGREFDPNEDGWVVDGDGNGIELGPLGGTTSGGMIPGTTSGGGQSGAAPAPDVPPPTPAPVPDDALLATLKQAYYDDFYASRGQSFVDTSTLPLLSENNVGTPGKPQRTATAQWRAYRYLSSRSDVWDASSGTVTMDVERLLQVYALKVFYLTFEWSVVGDDECAWPGVTCRGLGVHADDSEVGEDDLRVVGLSVRGDVSAADRRGPDLVGEMPLELAFLIHLEQIDLSHNRLDGELRGEVLGWKNVRVIELNDNLLVSPLPRGRLLHDMLRGVLAGPVRDVRVEGRRRDEARRVGRPYVRAEDQARPGERRPRHEAPRRQHAGVPGVRVARRGRPVRTGRGGLRRRQAPTSVRPVVRVLLGGGRALAQAGRVADPPGRVRLGGRLGVRRRRVGRDGPRPQGEQAQGGDRAGGHVPSGPGRAEHGVERPYRTDTERDREADETERAGARGEPPDVDPERGGAADGPRPRLPPVERLRGSDHAPGGVRAQAGPADPALGRLQRRRARP
ncbi:hypothetical protein THAOC_35511, partial [Thalassiosira oceanica]